MASRIVIDPITRIEGHLRIEIEVKDGAVTDAYSSGTMVRGFEIILKGRDPRDAWAFVERACGVCTTVHAHASVYAVEDALGVEIPPNAAAVASTTGLPLVTAGAAGLGAVLSTLSTAAGHGSAGAIRIAGSGLPPRSARGRPGDDITGDKAVRELIAKGKGNYY